MRDLREQIAKGESCVSEVKLIRKGLESNANDRVGVGESGYK